MKRVTPSILEGFHRTLEIVLPPNPTEGDIRGVLGTYAKTVGVDPHELENLYIVSAIMMHEVRTNSEFRDLLETLAIIDGVPVPFDLSTVNRDPVPDSTLAPRKPGRMGVT